MAAAWLPDFLARIRLREPPQVDEQGLQTLTRAFRFRVPFENLDVLAGVAVSTEPEAVIDKIVHRRRGGWCFELNTAFGELLKAVGFEVEPLLARVGYRRPTLGPPAHLLLRVRGLAGSWLVDVGFGAVGPGAALPDTTGRTVRLADFASAPALVVMFICNHCPYVKHVRAGLAQFGRDLQGRGVAVVAISANDPEQYPEDSPAKMAEEVRQAGYVFPYLHDASQAVARAYRAACTPDFYLFDAQRRLVYRGQFDESRPGNNVPVTGKDLRAAVEAVLAGRPVAGDQKPSIGCNIKWKTGRG